MICESLLLQRNFKLALLDIAYNLAGDSIRNPS